MARVETAAKGSGVTTATEKLRLHDLFAKHGLDRLAAWVRDEPDVILAAARGRHAWGSVRYGDRLMYEYEDAELLANALEELADAVNYLTVLEQRLAKPEPAVQKINEYTAIWHRP